MTNNPQANHTIPIIAIIIGVIGIVVTVAALAFAFSPSISEPTPTVTQQASNPSSLSSPYQPESVPLPTYTQGPTQTATIPPANTHLLTRTPFVLPTIVSGNQLLPDLTVSGISDPVCATEYEGTKLRFSIFVRNIGHASTRYFGTFDTDVYLILGQRRYGLDEWAEQFNGVRGSSVTEVVNLGPDEDIKFTVVIDLIGDKDFGIKVVTNSGENPIREADMTNNTLIEYFSASCY